jgi:hypothetical protein
MAVNGYPIFHSCGILTKAETEKLREYAIKYEEALKSV